MNNNNGKDLIFNVINAVYIHINIKIKKMKFPSIALITVFTNCNI